MFTIDYIISLSLLLLFINIFSLLKFNYKLLNKKYNFKSIDSFYINNIFKKKKKEIFNFKKKKTKSLFFTDIHFHFAKATINLLKKKFFIKISKKNPDYLIYNVFGCKHLKNEYNNSIKIAIFTENQIPDFNVADYAISLSHIKYLDRNFNSPYDFLKLLKRINIKKFDIIRKTIINNKKRNKFCAAVISNYHFTDYFRLDFINELNKYKEIDFGGRYKNNVGKIKNKIEFLSSYKFSIAMENTEGDGYISEKIVQSFLSGTIPIYYGSYMIDEYINPKSFILIRGKKDMKEKIHFIKEIDNNNDLYRNILNEKTLINENNLKELEKEYIYFLYHIFEQDKKKAKRT